MLTTTASFVLPDCQKLNILQLSVSHLHRIAHSTYKRSTRMINLERLQKPTGSYSIGFHHISLIDESREVEGKAVRELLIMIWYSASSVEGCTPKHYQPAKAFQFNYDLHFGMIKSLPWPLS